MSKLSVNELTDETGSGAPSFPNGMSVTGAALTDPEITGGIYLGGTGSANYLDDYEEGTWTPTAQDQNGNPVQLDSSTEGSYTKIGKIATIHCLVRISSLSGTDSSLDFEIRGLPFPAVRTFAGSVRAFNVPFDNSQPGTTHIIPFVTDARIKFNQQQPNTTSGANMEIMDLSSSSGFVDISITYFTND